MTALDWRLAQMRKWIKLNFRYSDWTAIDRMMTAQYMVDPKLYDAVGWQRCYEDNFIAPPWIAWEEEA